MIIKDPILLLAFHLRGFCDWCKRRGAVDAAHVFGRGMGGGTRLDIAINLASLCRPCHTEHHAGRAPTRDDLVAIVAARERMLQDDLRAEIRRILALPRKGIQ